ncbi:hypothetical protein EG68_04357 [Paragonimus skrjabini miyazakii]|uniref:RNA 3'-terminal phosphate cyclase-like protein n=1 Tax=Paragonimus skrjabini miyazakii TaxID=59628 RepID=A0A8S9YTK5_9TREM|nr:hypothetical protein EG68_04357 [Paragonimus skrjabini miyazakii]
MTSCAFRGPGNFRVKLALSLLSTKCVRITHIRNKSEKPGVDDSEVSLLKLIDEISNGTVITINDTGTIVTCKPGILIGGTFAFACNGDRGIGYFLEFLLMIAPFCKNAIDATLSGVTNSKYDPSLDMIKHAWIPIYRSLIGPAAAAHIKLEVLKRGVAPSGGGEVLFCSKPSTGLLPLTKVNPGKVYRVRGVAWTCRVSSGYGHKLLTGAKSLLNRFLSDVYITLDHRKDDSAGRSPGFGITLWAETKNDAVFSSECMSEPESPDAVPVDAELIGKTAASRLMEQIYQSGCVDSGGQSLALLMMACEAGRNASQLAIGTPTSYTISTLQLIRDFLGVTFHFSYQNRSAIVESTGPSDEDHPSASDRPPDKTISCGPDLLIATCFGAGLQNIGRAVR